MIVYYHIDTNVCSFNTELEYILELFNCATSGKYKDEILIDRKMKMVQIRDIMIYFEVCEPRHLHGLRGDYLFSTDGRVIKEFSNSKSLPSVPNGGYLVRAMCDHLQCGIHIRDMYRAYDLKSRLANEGDKND